MEFLKYLPTIPRKKSKINNRTRESLKIDSSKGMSMKKANSIYSVPYFGSITKKEESKKENTSILELHEEGTKIKHHRSKSNPSAFILTDNNNYLKDKQSDVIKVSEKEAQYVRLELESKYNTERDLEFVPIIQTLMNEYTNTTSQKIKRINAMLSETKETTNSILERSNELETLLYKADSMVNNAYNEHHQNRLFLRQLANPKLSFIECIISLFVMISHIFVILARIFGYSISKLFGSFILMGETNPKKD